jgi:hypothetical protein
MLSIVLLLLFANIINAQIEACKDARVHEARVVLASDVKTIRLNSIASLQQLLWDQSFAGASHIDITAEHLFDDSSEYCLYVVLKTNYINNYFFLHHTTTVTDQSKQNPKFFHETKSNELLLTLDLYSGSFVVKM